MPSIRVLQRLFLLINVLLNPEGRHEEFNHISEDAIQEMDNRLTAIERYDIRDVFRQTMAGDYRLLEQLEYRHGLRQYFITLYHGNHVQQETIEGLTENGNINAQETHQQDDDGNESERDTEERFRNGALSERSGSHSQYNQPRQANRLRPERPSADERKSPLRPPRAQPQERYFAEPSGPFQPEEPERELPRNRAQCFICGKYIQVLQDSRGFWQIVIESVGALTQQQFRKFVNAVNEYTGGILNYGMQPGDILVTLKRWNVNEDPKCVLCLLNYSFQRVGRGDLAEQIHGSLG